MGKLFGYHTLGVLLKSLSDSCFRADEQEKRGEKVTACGMSSDEIEDLCENYLPYALNPMMSTEEVKEKLRVSDATLNRMVARGDLPMANARNVGTPDIGRSGIFCTSLRVREVSDCLSFFVIYDITFYHLKSLIINH